MPPELIAYFKKKQGDGSDGKATPEEDREHDKTRRSDAVKKARIRLEEKNQRGGHDKEEETGEGRPEKS